MEHTIEAHIPKLSPQAANTNYGIEGALHFDHPISKRAAIFQHDTVRDVQWRAILEQRSHADPNLDIIAAGAGYLFDPIVLTAFAAAALLKWRKAIRHMIQEAQKS